jgi:hypothetical protein
MDFSRLNIAHVRWSVSTCAYRVTSLEELAGPAHSGEVSYVKSEPKSGKLHSKQEHPCPYCSHKRFQTLRLVMRGSLFESGKVLCPIGLAAQTGLR